MLSWPPLTYSLTLLVMTDLQTLTEWLPLEQIRHGLVSHGFIPSTLRLAQSARTIPAEVPPGHSHSVFGSVSLTFFTTVTK